MKLLVVIGVLLAASGGARADHRTSITMSGTCTEYVAVVLVDLQKAQALVPAGFTVSDLGGKALIGMFAEDCETSVDGQAAVPSSISGVFVQTEASQSPAGCGSYDFVWTDSVEGVWLAMSDLGWNMELVEDTGFDRSLAGVRAAVPGELAPWSTEAAATEAFAGPMPVISVHCHVGPRGLVRATFGHSITATAGAGALRLGDGPLWSALGAESQTVAPGLLLGFTWTGVIEIV